MTTNRRDSRNARERLLDGDAEQPGALAGLLSAARAPSRPYETHGLDAAVAAFSTAPPHLVVVDIDDRNPLMLKRLARRALALNVLAAAACAAAVGGIALAATSGNLSGPLLHPNHAAPTASDHAQHTPPVHPANSNTVSGSEHRTDPSATPSPSLVGLCKAWLARPSDAGKADSSAAFTVLLTTAGGVDAVDGYCTDLLAASTHPAGRSTDQPSLPSQASDHPTGKPSDLPTHPTGEPSDVPPVTTPSHPTGTP
jgi:hypothetical protein